VAPRGFVLRYGNTISRRIGSVHAGGYDSCLR
jgi:monofunctional glycosyltransferase